MKTTIYELLGMVKDDKKPKKIMINTERYANKIFNYNSFKNDYQDEDGDWLFEDYDWLDMLNDEVEILDEPKEDKIEKIDMFDYFTGYSFGDTSIDLLKHLENNFSVLNEKINEIIEVLNEKR